MKTAFNSRPHKEVDHLSRRCGSLRPRFQFTTSQGGRPAASAQNSANQAFQFTTSQGGRRRGCFFFPRPVVFQFTTSQGGRRQYLLKKKRDGSFNSRPHKEVDRSGIIQYRFRCLSIHDLTRRSTPPGNLHAQHIHPFNSRPHKEVDMPRITLKR